MLEWIIHRRLVSTETHQMVFYKPFHNPVIGRGNITALTVEIWPPFMLNWQQHVGFALILLDMCMNDCVTWLSCPIMESAATFS